MLDWARVRIHEQGDSPAIAREVMKEEDQAADNELGLSTLARNEGLAIRAEGIRVAVSQGRVHFPQHDAHFLGAR